MKHEYGLSEMPAKVQLKSGHTRYGMLLEAPAAIRNAWRFISSANITQYLITGNPKLVELLPDSAIVSIDFDLK